MLNLVAPLVLSLLPYYVVAQTSVKATCDAGFSWTFNSLNQSPCDVAAALAGVCIGGDFTLSALAPGYVYLGPDASNATPCRCSSVYYSLLAACSVCQTRNFIRWSRYKANCTTVYSQVFPQPIPNGIAVPHYAYLDIEADDGFNTTFAQAAGGPESTRLPTSTSASSSASTAAPGSTSSSAKTNVGAIAGGVVGGVVGLALIGGLIFWLYRHRVKIPAATSFDPVMASQNPASLGGASYTSSPAQKVYDPNDPATFPSGFPSSDLTGYNLPYTPSPELQQPNQPLYSNHMVPNHTGTTATSFPSVRPQYSGAPEL